MCYNPRQMERDIATLTSILTGIGNLCRARAVAVWETIEDQIHLVVDWQLDQALFDGLRSEWRRIERELRACDRLTLTEGVLLLPLRHGQALLGVLQYVGPPPPPGLHQQVLDETVQDIVGLLGATPPQACRRRIVPLLPVDLDGAPDALRRRTYGALHERCGGDASALAVALEMARSTLYERLNICGLARWKSSLRSDENGS